MTASIVAAADALTSDIRELPHPHEGLLRMVYARPDEDGGIVL